MEDAKKDVSRFFMGVWRRIARTYRRRAGSVPYRHTPSGIEILLIQSRKHKDRWIVPAGGVEEGETNDVAATRETIEEAGVTGSLGIHLGAFEDAQNRSISAMYALEVKEELSDWEEGRKGRERRWFSFKDALQEIRWKPKQIEIFESFCIALSIPTTPTPETTS
eukprot:GILK01010384.1.p1 GENE.GILK01010384.1~~GILK01010384.1.p1  ORF type:complete len:165 (-),score=12.36 GILK01010384.1:241-735(-)